MRVGLVLAQVELDAGGAQDRAGDAEVDGVLGRQPADAQRARDEDLVVGQQPVEVVGADQRLLDTPTDALLEVGRDVPGHAAGAEVGVHQAVAGDLFEEVEQVLALAEGVDERRTEDAEVGTEGAEEHEVAGDAVELGQDDADVLGALRRHEAGQLLDGLHVAQLGVELRQVLGAVLVADGLAVVHVLGQLLAAAVHVADVRDEVLDLFAVDGEHHAEDAVGRRVLRPDVDVEVDRVVVLRGPVFELVDRHDLLRLRRGCYFETGARRDVAGAGHVVAQARALPLLQRRQGLSLRSG